VIRSQPIYIFGGTNHISKMAAARVVKCLCTDRLQVLVYGWQITPRRSWSRYPFYIFVAANISRRL